eukprot:555339_1
MCFLMGMSGAQPTDFTFSLKGFLEKGGRTENHVDGWGVASYEGKGVRCWKEIEACATSLIANVLAMHHIRTLVMISHLRLATEGRPDRLENVHPFIRTLWGKEFSFAHNGHMPRVMKRPLWKAQYEPIGTTDSERLFCAILGELAARWPKGDPGYVKMSECVMEVWQDACNDDNAEECDPDLANEKGESSIGNIIMSDGCLLWAGCWPGKRPGSNVWNSLHYIVRSPPFSTAKLIDAGEYCIASSSSSVTCYLLDLQHANTNAFPPSYYLILRL